MHMTDRRDDIVSPFVRSIVRTVFAGSGTVLMQPDGMWDIVFLRSRSGLQVLRTGLTTRPVEFGYADGDELLAVGFTASSYMPAMPGDQMRNKGVLLERIGSDRFRVGSDIFEVPRLDNAEDFVARLIKRDTIERNLLVESIVSGQPNAATERTMQRHFLRTTGLTMKAFDQIARAREAAELLRAGEQAATVAYALGYADQPHLIRSLRSIMGQTPRQIAAAAPETTWSA